MATGLLTADAPGLGSAFGPPQWGIFKQGGQPILVTDSVADVDYTRDYQISTYPQESGAFQSYNKVQRPFQSKVGFYISTTRTQFLNAIEFAVESLDLVTVVTPEIRYPSANLIRYNYRREARSGVSMFRVEVWCEEVRIVSGAALSKSQSTNAAGATQSGIVQPVETTQNAPTGTDGAPAADGTPAATPATVGGSFPTTTGNSGETVFFQPETGQAIVVAPGASTTTIPEGIPSATGSAGAQLPPTTLTFTDGIPIEVPVPLEPPT